MESKKHIILLPEEDMIINIIPLLLKNGNDYSGNLVIFPNKRPSLYIRRAISMIEKKPFIPPVIMSMDEFIDHIYEEILGIEDIKIDMTDAIAIIHDLFEKGVNLDEFYGAGQKLFNDFEELKIEDIDDYRAKIVDISVKEQLTDRLKERLTNFSELYKEFYEEINKMNLSTRSSRYHKVAKSIDSIHLNFKRIIVCGIYEITRTEMQIFKSLLSDERTIFILREGKGIEDTLKKLNIEHKGGEREELRTKIAIFRSPDLHGEVLSVASILNKMIEEGVKPVNTAFILPSSETLFPFYHNVLCMFSPEDYNISLSYPLRRTPLYIFFETLMELINSMDGNYFYIPYYLNFVLHPYIKNIRLKNSAEYSRILFHTLERELTRIETRRFMTREEILSDKIINEIKNELSGYGIDEDDIKRHIMTIHENTINRMEGFTSIDDFSKKIIDIIKYIYNKSTAKEHPFFFPYSQAFLREMERLSRSLLAQKSFRDRNSYFLLFKKHLSTCYMPFERTDPLKEIQVLGFLETRNLKFDKVFILDVNEGILPSLKRDDTYLSPPLRNMLGITTLRERERLIEYYFECLLRSAEEVYIYYLENRDMEGSRFIEKICWDIQKRNRIEDNDFIENFIKRVNYPITLKNYTPRKIPKTPEMIDYLKNFRYSATSIDTYKECQVRFYYEHVLGLKSKSKISISVENLEIGTLIHEILNEYLKDKKGKILFAHDLDTDRLNTLIEKIMMKRFGENIFGETLLIKKQIKKRFHELIENYQKPMCLRHRIEILSLEESFEERFNSVRLYAKIDRIEKRDDKVFLIDYKTSHDTSRYKISFQSIGKKPLDKVISSFQLPIYQLVYHLSQRIEPSRIIPLYLMLGKKDMDDMEYRIYEKVNNPEKAFKDVMDILSKLIDEILDINTPFVPADDPKKCSDCDYKTICLTEN